jgi:hypothetical protein
MPHLCKLYPGICLTTEEKARKNLSQGSWRMPVGIRISAVELANFMWFFLFLSFHSNCCISSNWLYTNFLKVHKTIDDLELGCMLLVAMARLFNHWTQHQFKSLGYIFRSDNLVWGVLSEVLFRCHIKDLKYIVLFLITWLIEWNFLKIKINTFCSFFCYTIQLMHYLHFKTHSLQHLKPIKC